MILLSLRLTLNSVKTNYKLSFSWLVGHDVITWNHDIKLIFLDETMFHDNNAYDILPMFDNIFGLVAHMLHTLEYDLWWWVERKV